ncbi:MAG: hypothetical protein ACREAC_16240, partial [Blastocatellia bacterium]
LWFPTSRGLAVVDPNSVTIDSVPPPVLIEGVQIDREAVATGSFQSAINQRSAITLKPGQTGLEID